jgi:glycosyltransferase involved in cell wall biosynthesis
VAEASWKSPPVSQAVEEVRHGGVRLESCRQDTIYHGLPEKLLTPLTRKAPEYLAFLGRMCPEKRPDLAIEIAAQSGLPLKIAAKIDKADQEYFKTEIEPRLSQAHVEFLGEISEQQKPPFLSGAKALLFPIDWSSRSALS